MKIIIPECIEDYITYLTVCIFSSKLAVMITFPSPFINIILNRGLRLGGGGWVDRIMNNSTKLFIDKKTELLIDLLAGELIVWMIDFLTFS